MPLMSDEFIEFKNRAADRTTDPEAVVGLFLEALVTLERDETLGTQKMALLLAPGQLSPDPSALSGQRISRMGMESVRRLLRNANIARSYVGGSYQRGYADFSPDDLRVTLDRSNPRSGLDYPSPGRAKYFVFSGGADSARPITLTRTDDGAWKVHEYSSLTTGVRKPA